MSRTAKPYTPEPGTVPAKVLAHFQERPDLYEMSSAELADAFGFPVKNVSGTLANVVRNGLLAVRRQGRQCFYRKGDGKPLAKVFSLATPLPSDPPAAPLAPTAHGLTAALYNDGELYLHGVQTMADGGVLLSAVQTAELRAYLLHTGQVSSIASANGGSLT